MRQSITLLSIILALLSACAPVEGPRYIYYWGGYENMVYAMQKNEISPEQQLASLEAGAAQAKGLAQTVAPGYNAHLGMLYFQLGKKDQALKAFEAEKTLFPESTVYMNRLIARIKP